MSVRLKASASINDQIKLLANIAKLVNNEPHTPLDTIINYCEFSGDQLRIFMLEYRRAGDDPLEV